MTELIARPILDRVLILQDQGESEVASIYIPESERQKPCKGTVVAIGTGWVTSTTGQLISMTVKVGDKVVYNEHTATVVNIDGVDYMLIKENDILVIL